MLMDGEETSLIGRTTGQELMHEGIGVGNTTPCVQMRRGSGRQIISPSISSI